MQILHKKFTPACDKCLNRLDKGNHTKAMVAGSVDSKLWRMRAMASSVPGCLTLHQVQTWSAYPS